MARGWESKSVEEQIESAQWRAPRGVSQAGPSVVDIELVRKRENLALSRTRILHELETSRNPRYVTLLNRELAALDERLLQLS